MQIQVLQNTQLVISLAEGVVTALPELADATLEIITSLVEGIAAALPVLGEAALSGDIVYQAFRQLCDNIDSRLYNHELIPELIPVVAELIMRLFNYVVGQCSQKAGRKSGLQQELAWESGR